MIGGLGLYNFVWDNMLYDFKSRQCKDKLLHGIMDNFVNVFWYVLFLSLLDIILL